MLIRLRVVAILEGVAVAVIVGVCGWAANWLRVGGNRTKLRQAVCRHQWKPYDDLSGDGILFVTPYVERCRKCGKAR